MSDTLDIQIAIELDTPDIEIEIEEENPEIEMEVTMDGSLPAYTGKYEVQSGLYEDEILKTGGKSMQYDMTVKPIRFTELGNPSGGITVIIG